MSAIPGFAIKSEAEEILAKINKARRESRQISGRITIAIIGERKNE